MVFVIVVHFITEILGDEADGNEGAVIADDGLLIGEDDGFSVDFNSDVRLTGKSGDDASGLLNDGVVGIVRADKSGGRRQHQDGEDEGKDAFHGFHGILSFR